MELDRRHGVYLVVGGLLVTAGFYWLTSVHEPGNAGLWNRQYVGAAVFVLAGMAFLLLAFFDKLPGLHAAAPPEHIEDVRQAAESMGRAIGLSQRVGTLDRRTSAVLAHLTDLREPTDSWDAALRADLESKKTFRKAIAKAVALDGLDQPPFVGQNLQQALEAWSMRIVLDAADLDKNYILTTAYLPEHPEHGIEISIDPPPMPRMMVAGVTALSSVAECVDYENRIQQTFRACYRLPEGHDVLTAHAARAQLQAALPPVFSDVRHRHDFSLRHVAKGCPHCAKGATR